MTITIICTKRLKHARHGLLLPPSFGSEFSQLVNTVDKLLILQMGVGYFTK